MSGVSALGAGRRATGGLGIPFVSTFLLWLQPFPPLRPLPSPTAGKTWVLFQKLVLQHPWLQPPRSWRRQALGDFLQDSVPSLFLRLLHYLVPSLEQPRNNWKEVFGEGPFGSFPLHNVRITRRNCYVFIELCCYQ
ncbi:hypothetical protein HJG60_010946 [Phyllostomus discolor]|uniref:Uncharacterized protein n=1 Tax=Phyllostomus discolor TaxID=89673 RepID=A0A834AEX5_9CHIR|nr:hypothetical protein HJG60_010946 [Phyllostomus discolor]